MRTLTRPAPRLAALLLGAGLLVSSCGGSDGPSASDGAAAPTSDASTAPVTDPPETPPPDTEPADEEPPVTDEVTPDQGSADEPPATDATDDGPTPDESPDGSGDFLSEPLIADDQIDDVPVCQAFGAFFNRFGGVAFAGAFVGLDEEISGEGDDEYVLESLELLAFSGLGDEVAVLRSETPAVVSSIFEPIFVRVDAAARLLLAAGFSEAELAVIDEAYLSGEDSPELEGLDADPRLIAAAEALRTEAGSLLDVVETLDEPADEAEADAWLEGTCPVLAAALDE